VDAVEAIKDFANTYVGTSRDESVRFNLVYSLGFPAETFLDERVHERTLFLVDSVVLNLAFGAAVGIVVVLASTTV
jgi:hypothetical protein